MAWLEARPKNGGKNRRKALVSTDALFCRSSLFGMVAVRRRNGVTYVSTAAGTAALPELARYPEDEEADAEGALVAPMPGKVIRLVTAAGEAVERGDVIAVLEAMKMEHELTAPAAGTLAELRVSEGDQVDSGAVIGVIETAETPET